MKDVKILGEHLYGKVGDVLFTTKHEKKLIKSERKKGQQIEFKQLKNYDKSQLLQSYSDAMALFHYQSND